MAAGKKKEIRAREKIDVQWRMRTEERTNHILINENPVLELFTQRNLSKPIIAMCFFIIFHNQ